jgi:hypothetical protein
VAASHIILQPQSAKAEKDAIDWNGNATGDGGMRSQSNVVPRYIRLSSGQPPERDQVDMGHMVFYRFASDRGALLN